MDRLSALDTSFLALEDEVTHLHVGTIAVVEGPAPDPERVAALVRARLADSPRHRQRVQSVPLSIARPVWVDADQVDLAYHVRHTALPRPGGADQLQALVGRVMAQPLDRRRPLWELWVVDGIDEEHHAVVAKVHPALLGGERSVDLLSALLDDRSDAPEPDPDGATSADDAWAPRASPSSLALVREAVEDALSPALPLALARSAMKAPTTVLGGAVAGVRGLASLAGMAQPKSSPGLTGPLGPHRRWAWTTLALDDARRFRDALGGTVTDVVLALVAAGFRDLLEGRGVDTAGRSVRTLLPVTMHRPGASEGQVSAMFTDLPLGEVDPRVTLAAVAQQTSRLKASGQAVAASGMTTLAGLAPPMLLALGVRAAARVVSTVDEMAVDTIVTNVPGAAGPRWLLGSPVLHLLPCAPLVDPVRIAVAVHSYDGELAFGITADHDGVPDLADFVAGLEAGILELEHAAAEDAAGTGAAALIDGPAGDAPVGSEA